MFRVAGYVEVDPSLFAPGVLEDGLRRQLGEDPLPLIFHNNPAAGLGEVTKVEGRGDRLLIEGTVETQPPRSALADVYKKVLSGTIKGLSLLGDFSRDRAIIAAFSITPLPLEGSGFLTEVTED